MSRVTAIILPGYLHRLPVMAVNHYRDNAITHKAQRTKCQRTAGERGNYWHADASAWCCCARCKIHEGVSWMLKLKMMLCVMMLPLSSSVAHQSSLSVAWSYHYRRDKQCSLPLTGRHRWTGLFHPQREGWSLCKKTTGRNSEVY